MRNMFEVIFLERMEIEHLLRFLDVMGLANQEQQQSQLHRLRSKRIIRSRVRYWLNDIVDEMRKKSPASVQKWVDSIQMPNSGGAGSSSTIADHHPIAIADAPQPSQDEPDGNRSVVTDHDQLMDGDAAAAVEQTNEEEGQQLVGRVSPADSQKWVEVVEKTNQDQGDTGEEEQTDDFEGNRTTEHVLKESVLKDTTDRYATAADAFGACGTTSTPKVAKMDDGCKASAESTGLSLRNFLSKKSLLGKFSRSGSNLDHSPTTAAENSPTIGLPGSLDGDEPDRRLADVVGGGAVPSQPFPSAFVVGKSKINEFYDKLSMNKAKYSLIKGKKLDLRNMLGGVTLAGRESFGASKVRGDVQPEEPRTGGESVQGYESEREEETAVVGETLRGELENHHHDRSISPQHPAEPLEVSVVDMDPSDAYEFSFDESFPKSDELIPGMISEEDEEKENILDSTPASVAVHHGYGYDAYLNPPKPKTHRIGIGRIGRSSSENPRATARRYNLMEIGRSFSEMNDDDDSFAISECNNSCPNPSSLNTSSSINEHDSTGNLTRSVPVSPIPRASSKLSIQQEHLGQHVTPAQLQQQHSLVEQSSHHRRRSTMLVKDSSLQSDSSRCSSVESLLNARKPDPEKILLNLGFGPAPHSTDVLAKIPKRFLKPSQVRGVDTEAFLRQQQLSMHIHENSVLGYRGLVGNPHIPPSMIVAKIMERFQENDSKTRLTAAGVPLPQSDSRNSSGPPSPVPMTRHGSLATTDGRLKF